MRAADEPASPANSDANLIPVSIHDDEPAATPPSRIFGTMAFVLLPFLIGFAIAEGIHRGTGFDEYMNVIDTTLKPRRLYWLYFSAVVCAWLTRWLNAFPMAYKNAAMEAQGKAASGNIRANMYLYMAAKDPIKPIVLIESGAAGQYNRANRSLHHYIENALGPLLLVPLAGFVYPGATFVLTLLFAVGRIAHQAGYAIKGYGGHGLGFAIALIATLILEGLVLVAGLCAAGVPL